MTVCLKNFLIILVMKLINENVYWQFHIPLASLTVALYIGQSV